MTDTLAHPAAVPAWGGLIDTVPVVPVVVLHDLETAVPVAEALLAGGVPVIELTLRTPAALACVERIAAEVPDILLGVGTVVTPANARDAAAAGAQFLVSPGTTDTLASAMQATGLPHLPGAATVSEVLRLLELGYTECKLFPAEQSGGAAFLKSLGAPVPQARFCPTGGITATSAPAYLALDNVGCVGGSWLTPADAVASGDWSRITTLAAETTYLRG